MSGLAEIPYRLWNMWVYFALWCISFAASLWWPALWPSFVQPSSGVFEAIQAAGALAAATALLCSAVHFSVLALLPQVVRAHALGFGQENVLDNLFVHITAARAPEPCDSTEIEYTIQGGPSLRHSSLYQDERVLRDMAGIQLKDR